MAYRIPRYDESSDFKARSSLAVWIERLRHSALGCLVATNIVIFLVLKIISLCGLQSATEWLCLAGPFGDFVRAPWGLFSYMFVHVDVIHLLFNMLWLWAFGVIVTRFDGPRRLLICYVLSGMGGGLCFLFATFSVAATTWLYGASGAVLGVIAYAAVRNGSARVQLVLFGTVQIRWIALVAIVLCMVSGGPGNTPALAAHIGGVITGAFFAIWKKWLRASLKPSRKRGKRYTTLTRSAVSSDWHPTKVREHERRGLSEDEQAEFDTLLTKVRKIGYNNMSAADRRRLFELSSHIK